jgi:hypothetical protein
LHCRNFGNTAFGTGIAPSFRKSEERFSGSRNEDDMPAEGSAQQREEEIERLAAQTGRLIRDAEPASRAELAEAASAILREEALSGQAAALPQQAPGRRPMNPLAAGIGILMVGAGLTLLFPLVGIAVMACGVIAIIAGVILSMVRK